MSNLGRFPLCIFLQLWNTKLNVSLFWTQVSEGKSHFNADALLVTLYDVRCIAS